MSHVMEKELFRAFTCCLASSLLLWKDLNSLSLTQLHSTLQCPDKRASQKARGIGDPVSGIADCRSRWPSAAP